MNWIVLKIVWESIYLEELVYAGWKDLREWMEGNTQLFMRNFEVA